MNAPCKGCQDRVVQPNCHLTCARYLEYNAERERIRDERLHMCEYQQAREDRLRYNCTNGVYNRRHKANGGRER